jgi:exodeoxyribonuclease VII small subunit
MKKKKDDLSFDKAYTELEEISRAIQSGTIGIDDLSVKVARASELIKFCKQKLRTIEGDLTTVFDQLNDEEDA